MVAQPTALWHFPHQPAAAQLLQPAQMFLLMQRNMVEQMHLNNGAQKCLSAVSPQPFPALQPASTPPANTTPDFGLLCNLAAMVDPGPLSNAQFANALTTNLPKQDTAKPAPKPRSRAKSNLDARDMPARVFPRRKAGQAMRPNNEPVVLSEEVLTSLFDLPLQEACAKLGICATALKKACRRLGIKKWPYKSNASPVSKQSSEGPDRTSSNTSVLSLLN